jgi:hypothetical protein
LRVNATQDNFSPDSIGNVHSSNSGHDPVPTEPYVLLIATGRDPQVITETV